MASNGTSMASQPVTVSLEEIRSGSVPFQTLEEAFGPESLGIILVRGLPKRFHSLRSEVLSNASYLAHLPRTELESLTNAAAKYLVGWSHGKETLRPGVVDTLKGSYYVNCAFYQSAGLSSAPADSFPDFPEYTAPNIWPSKEHLPAFRSSVEALCTLIIDVAVLVARACDRYGAEKVTGYETGYLEHVVKTSMTTKARLLHYFPSPKSASITNTKPSDSDDSAVDDDWCATHLDHGCLTGLTSAMYISEPSPFPPFGPSSSPLPEFPSPPSPEAGLYIRSRVSQTCKVSIPRDCLAFQTGEALELITKGAFRAVPHFVRGAGAKGERVARNTLAVFTQPNLGEVVDLERGTTFGEFARGVVNKNTAS